ncbi:MAG: 4-alpha-glucanotransferase [Pseudolabrys sp.]
MRCFRPPGGRQPLRAEQRLFLNPLYIDVEAIPEFPGVMAAGLEADIAALSATPMVNYTGVAHAKLVGLRFAYDGFRRSAAPERRADFEAYRQEQGEALLRFACFETLRQQLAPRPWTQWDAPWRDPSAGDLRNFREQNRALCEFREFLQWTANASLGRASTRRVRMACRSGSMSMSLWASIRMAPMPGASRTRCWRTCPSARRRTNSIRPARTGGLAPFNPHGLSANDFAPMRALLTAAMRYAGAIRLDHVLGPQNVSS